MVKPVKSNSIMNVHMTTGSHCLHSIIALSVNEHRPDVSISGDNSPRRQAVAHNHRRKLTCTRSISLTDVEGGDQQKPCPASPSLVVMPLFISVAVFVFLAAVGL